MAFVRMSVMPTESRNLDSLSGLPGRDVSEKRQPRTPRPAIGSLGVSVLASAGCGVAAATLPWFGLGTPGGDVFPDFISTSSALSVPPFGSGQLAPAKQDWGYLLIVWSAVVAGLALEAI